MFRFKGFYKISLIYATLSLLKICKQIFKKKKVDKSLREFLYIKNEKEYKKEEL